MAGLTDLLQDLCSDSQLADSYRNNREAVFDQYKLSEEERQALRNEDIDKLKELSGISDLRTTNHTIRPCD